MAALGRWTSVDPIAGFPGERHPQWSPYAYVLDNPLALVDPDGRQVAANGLNTPLASINGFRPPNVAGAFRQLRSDLNTAAALSGNPTLAAGAAGLGLLRFAGDLIGALDPAGAAGLGPGAVLESGAVAGTRMAGALADDGARLSNPVSTRLARIVEADFVNAPSLGAPGTSEAFVTSADDLLGITTSKGLANRLTLLDPQTGGLRSGPFGVIEFDVPGKGLASPLNRDNLGFIGGGRTAGGAREFVVPNLYLSDLDNVTRRIVE